jgi:hypothetical protein
MVRVPAFDGPRAGLLHLGDHPLFVTVAPEPGRSRRVAVGRGDRGQRVGDVAGRLVPRNADERVVSAVVEPELRAQFGAFGQ